MQTSLKVIFRSIIRFKFFSGLNIVGLGVGLTAVIFIFFWIYHESTYDKFNENYEQIYQVNHLSNKDGERWSGTPSPLAPAIAENVAAIENSVRIRRCATLAFKAGEKMFIEEYGATADPSIIDIFTFEVLSGNPKEALTTSGNILLTESLANKYCGNLNPLNQQITLEGRGEVTVKAVIKDLSSNTHLKFDYLLSHQFAIDYRFCGLGWGDPNFLTYVKLNKNSDPQTALSAITEVAIDNKAPHIFYGGHEYKLRPLSNIYLDHEVANQIGESGDKRNVFVFGTIGILILLLACINYINLSVSLFTKRKRNISIHKVCGAFKDNIFYRYLTETLIVILFAFALSILLVLVLKPIFNNFIGKEIEFAFSQPFALGFMVLLLIGVVVLCGIYPSLILSNFNPLGLVDKFNHQRSKNRGIKTMVIVQNVISILLVIGTIGVVKQMNFIKNKELGFNSDKIIYVRLRGQISQHIETVKHEISSLPGVRKVAMKDCPPFDNRNNTTGIIWRDNGELMNSGEDTFFGTETTKVDDKFFPMMDVNMVKGRNFDQTISSDKANYIVNQEAVRQMNISKPIGAELALYGKWGQIIGVIEDTYFKSLHKKVEPQVFHMYNNISSESYFSILNIKLSGPEIQKTLKEIESVWNNFNPAIPFSYHFLDEKYEALYKSDKRVAAMIKIFSLFAVFVACLGLLGQSVFAAENRIKEIGIRKVNGARISEILRMLNKDFIKWVAIAFVVACPIAYFAMNKWLENFAYKTTLSWWIFALAGVLALGIALLTVSWQSWRAATRNPVEALRYE